MMRECAALWCVTCALDGDLPISMYAIRRNERRKLQSKRLR